ncbi:MAG: hemolysin family protein [Fibrobacteraceae bacterium]|nr:hemolysin family protein [Fibrobacteraceae bacterium]
MAFLFIAVFFCLACSAFCSLTEAAFYSFPASSIEGLVKRGAFSAKYIAHVKSHIDRYIASVLIFNTVANTAGVSIATSVAVAHFSLRIQILLPVVMSVLILLFGEITPKTIGVKQAKKVAPICAVPMYYITVFLGWTGLIKLCMTITNRWTRKKSEDPEVSVEDINSLVNLGLRDEVLDRQQAAVIKNILALKSVTVRKIMTPRQVAFALPLNSTIGAEIDKNPNWPYSRIPVYDKNREKWEGIILRRDVYNHLAEGERDIPLRKLMRPIQFVPDSLTLDKLLLRFLKQRGHIVAVVDEWGSIAGLASLEDVLEEILGREIVDEFDVAVDLQEHARRKSKALAFLKEHERETRHRG